MPAPLAVLHFLPSTLAMLTIVVLLTLVLLCPPPGVHGTGGTIVQTTDPRLELEYDFENLPVTRQGRDHLLSQFVRYKSSYDASPNFFVVYDTFEQQESDTNVGNTTFIAFDLKEQNSLANLIELNVENEDLDDSDLLFTFMITVPHIAHENRYCLTSGKVEKFDNLTTITCFVVEGQTLSIHFYPLTDLKSGFTKHVPLNGTEFAILNSRRVYMDDRHVYVSIVQLSPHPNLLTIIRFDLSYLDSENQYLVFDNLANTTVLMSSFSNESFAVIYETTQGVVMHLIDRSMFKSVNHVTIAKVVLPKPEKGSEYITRDEKYSNIPMSILVHNKTLDNISIIQFTSGNSTHISYQAIPLESTAITTIDSMNYAFVRENELAIYGMTDTYKFSYARFSIADDVGTIIEQQFSVLLRTKKYKEKYAPIILLTNGEKDSPHYFAALLGSQIRLFKDNVSRSSSYDFSIEDTTITTIHDSVIKNDTLVMVLEGCIALVDLKDRLFVEIFRLSYGNSRTFISTITANPEEGNPYFYLTHDSEMRGTTKFMEVSLITKQIAHVTSEDLLHSKNGLFHRGLIYYMSTKEIVVYNTSDHSIHRTSDLDDVCFSELNFLYLLDETTLLSVGHTCCDIPIHNFTDSGREVRRTIFESAHDVNLVHLSYPQSKLLLFQYQPRSMDTKISVVPFGQAAQSSNDGPSDEPTLKDLEVRAALAHSFNGKNYTLVFGQEPFMPTSRMLLLSDKEKTLASINHLPIQVRTAFQLNDKQLLLIGDRMQVLFFTVDFRVKDVNKSKPDRTLQYVLPSVIIPLATFGLLSFILFLLAYYRLSKRRKMAQELEVRLLSEMEMEVSSADGINNLNSYMIPIEDITFSKRLSEGASGVVFLGSWKGAEVAIKRFKVDDEQSFIKEVTILAQLRHPYLLALYGASIDDHGHHYMITPFAKNGSLDNLLYKSKAVISFSEKLRILSQMAQAMTYLHKKEPRKIIHRDLKPQNVLLQDANQVKICDFGVSKTTSSNTMTIQSFGTLEYMAPELLLQLARYDEKVDVYSFGIMMYELFFRKKPYSELESGLGLFALGNKVLLGERPKIPFDFETEDAGEQRTIIEQFVNEHQLHKLQSRLNEEFKQAILSCVRSYFVLSTRCWRAAPEERPSFPSIEIELKHIQDRMQPFGI